MTPIRFWRPAVLVKTKFWVGCSVSRAHKTWSRSFLCKDFPVHTNPDIFKTAYFVTRFRVDGALNHSGERFQKDANSVSGFTGFGRFGVNGVENMRFKHIRTRVGVALGDWFCCQ